MTMNFYEENGWFTLQNKVKLKYWDNYTNNNTSSDDFSMMFHAKHCLTRGPTFALQKII